MFWASGGCPPQMVLFLERSGLLPGPQGHMLWKQEREKFAGIAVSFVLCPNKNRTEHQRPRLDQVRSRPDLVQE